METKKLISNLLSVFLLVLFGFPVFSQTGRGGQGVQITETIGAGISDAQELVAKAQEKKAKIDAVFKKVTENNLFKTIAQGEPLSFPIGILPDNGNSNYALVINDVKMDVNGMFAEAYMKIPINSETHLYLMADRVPVNNSGSLALTGDMSLYLLKGINFDVGKGYDITLKGLDNPNKAYTYATFDCSGFKEIFVNGKLNFKERAIVKYDSTNKKDVTTKIELDFHINADQLANVVLKFKDVPDFQFKKLPGFRCYAPELTLDFSELRNAPDFNLPDWYLDSLQKKEPNLDRDLYTSPLWEGVYIPLVEIDIPRKFTEGKKDPETGEPSKNPEEIVKITTKDFIVDQYGVTALTKAENVLSGNLKGFDYRVDSLRLNVIANSISKAGFYGQMTFPICKEESSVAYGLTITKGLAEGSELEYQGYAQLDTDLEASAFGKATLNLTGADLDFEIKNNQFFPKLTIDGSIDLTLKKDKKNADGSTADPSTNDDEQIGETGLEFKKLSISSSAPYIEIQKGGYAELKTGANSTLAKLPITVNKVGLKNGQGGEEIGLAVNLSVSLQQSKSSSKESSNGFGATTDFVVWAKRNASTGRFKYHRFDLNNISVDADLGAIQIQGGLTTFSNDKVYDKGFCGNLTMTVVDKITVSASAIFGRKIEEDYRYWFVDASVKFPTPIIFAPGVGFNSFSGGAYKNMEMVGGLDDPETGSTVECKTATGRTYIPRKDVFGLLAGIGVQSAGGGSGFNGEINFGIEFFTGESGSGLKRLATWGNVKIMSDFELPGLDKVAAAMDASGKVDIGAKKQATAGNDPTKSDGASAVMVNWFVEYDKPNETLAGDFDIYVNLKDAVKGIGPSGKAGRISFLASPGLWYLYIGTPTDQVGVNVLDLAELGAYMCMGSQLPDPPIAPFPPGITPPTTIDYSLLSLGGGISFGARLSLGGTFSKGVGICKARAEAELRLEAGFDILLSKTQHPVYCVGQSEERGFKNWYATGQVYLLGVVDVSVKWECLGGGSAHIIKAFMEASAFGQLPKPTYVAGRFAVGVQFLKFKEKKVSFNGEFGDQCQLEEPSPTEVDLIEAILPGNDVENISVSEKIEILFTEPMYDFQFTMVNSNRQRETFRPSLDPEAFKITTPDNKEISFKAQLSSDKLSLILVPTTLLPANTVISVIAGVTLQKQNGEKWVDDNTFYETIQFTTGDLPERIPMNTVSYAYPSVDMQNFYANETQNGYISFSTLPGDLVKIDEQVEEYVVAIYRYNEEIDRVNNVEYNNTLGENNFTFKIPTLLLKQNSKYRFKLLVSAKETNSIQGTTTSGEITKGAIELAKDRILMEYDFRTSLYKTFKEKMALYSSSVAEIVNGVISADLSVNNLDNDNYEPLSLEEVAGVFSGGVKVTPPLIQMSTLKVGGEAYNSGVDVLNNNGTLDLVNNSVGKSIDLASDVLSQSNDALQRANLQCLLSNGGCSRDDLKVIEIPSGRVSLNVSYYLPGLDVPSSTHVVFVDVDEKISLPY